MEILADNWQFFLTLAATLGGGTLALWRYLHARRSELAWRRTEFLFERARYLDADPEIRQIMLILYAETGFAFHGQLVVQGDDGVVHTVPADQVVLEDQHPETIALILDPESPLTYQTRLELRFALDKLLNFFDRLHYAVFLAHTLSVTDVALFAWHMGIIESDQHLRSYCLGSGFDNVIDLAEAVVSHVPEPDERPQLLVKRSGDDVQFDLLYPSDGR
jgi:hypothetical protein